MNKPGDTCPKCESTRVVPMTEAYSGLTWPKTLRGFRTETFCCVNCGYTEMYVRANDMAKLQATYDKKMGPQGPIIR